MINSRCKSQWAAVLPIKFNMLVDYWYVESTTNRGNDKEEGV